MIRQLRNFFGLRPRILLQGLTFSDIEKLWISEGGNSYITHWNKTHLLLPNGRVDREPNYKWSFL